MVIIVEIEIFYLLPLSNWSDFDQKCSKIGHFGSQMAQNLVFLDFFAFLCPNLSNFVFKVIARYS